MTLDLLSGGTAHAQSAARGRSASLDRQRFTTDSSATRTLAGRSGGSWIDWYEKRVDDGQPGADDLPVLQVLGIDDIAAGYRAAATIRLSY
jgi:hypothetical protein